jgi:N6-adenosine-specific RNA methylase IME4
VGLTIIKPKAAPVDHALPQGPFGCLLADPPWRFALRSEKGNEKSPDQHYDTMTLAQIKAMPIADLCAKDAGLMLWATWPMLDFARETMIAWGFTYSTGGSWMKQTVRGKEGFGTGFRLRSASECFLIGTRGNPPLKARNIRNLLTEPEKNTLAIGLQATLREHSRKPDAQYEIAEGLFAGPYLELFSRNDDPRKDWTHWGLELEKFT